MTRALRTAVLAAMVASAAHAATDMPMSDHMNDDPVEYKVMLDELEFRDVSRETPFVWDAKAWVGRDRNRLYLRSEGATVEGSTAATVEALWARPISRWWNLALGVREDLGPGDSRTWLALGVMGVAPYRFNVQATAYLGEAGQTALRVETEYDMLLTNRLILQPRLELDAYGKDDPGSGIESGVSMDLGLRLRYEIRREFAPYVGVNWDTHELQALAGLHIWF
jgi:copper resistance protein B